MFSISTFQGSNRAAWLIGMTVVGVLILVTLAGIGSHLVVWGQQVSSRPVVLHLDRVLISAEITAKPFCAPLLPSSDICLVHHSANHPKYFSVWVYLVTPPNAEWHISGWHVVAFRLGPER